MLTLVGRGAKYSGVMYLSPTLEIMVVTEPRSLLDVDVDDVEICSRIVMGSRFQEFKQNRNWRYSQTLLPSHSSSSAYGSDHITVQTVKFVCWFCKRWKTSFCCFFVAKNYFRLWTNERSIEDTSQKQARRVTGVSAHSSPSFRLAVPTPYTYVFARACVCKCAWGGEG